MIRRKLLSLFHRILENLYAGHAGRVVLMVSGPCNAGPGTIVSRDKSESIRSHLDIQKEQPNAKYVKNALSYYASIAARAVTIYGGTLWLCLMC